MGNLNGLISVMVLLNEQPFTVSYFTFTLSVYAIVVI